MKRARYLGRDGWAGAQVLRLFLFLGVIIVCKESCSAQRCFSVGVGLNTTQTSPLQVAGGFRLVTESKMGKMSTFRVDLLWSPFANESLEFGKYGKVYNIWVRGWGADIGPRWYFGKGFGRVPEGFFIQPNFVYRRVKESFIGFQVDDQLASRTLDSYPFLDLKVAGDAFGVGLAMGWKFLFEPAFVEVMLSVDYTQAQYPSTEEHKIINQYFSTKSLVNGHLQLNIGLIDTHKTARTILSE